MTLGEEKVRWWRFRLRSLMVAVFVVGIVLGWWLDQRNLRRELTIVRLTQGSWQTRRAVVEEYLSTYRGKDEVPFLIYALSDPDVMIATQADRVLREVSGNSQGFGSVEDSTPQERLRIMRGWIDWYLSAANPFE